VTLLNRLLLAEITIKKHHELVIYCSVLPFMR
jgi:hypothetical protein